MSNLQDLNISLTSQFVSKFTEFNFISDLLNISLYPIDVNITISTTVDINNFITKFIYNINNDLKTINIPNISPQIVRKQLNVAKLVIDIKKQGSSRQVTYENIKQHFQNRDIHVEKLISHVINNKITSSKVYRETFSNVIQTIQLYNLMTEMRFSFINFDTLFENFKNPDIPLAHHINKFKEIVFEARNQIATLDIIDKTSKESNYFILNNDPDNIKNVSESITRFLQTGYSFFKTNYSLIDTHVGGLESSSVSIISGPSNHAKSLFMLNMIRNIAENNTFEENDVIIMVTLEDDIYKLFRRVMSIFGNYQTSVVRDLFIHSSQYLKSIKDSSNNLYTSSDDPKVQKIIKLLYQLLSNTIKTITNNNVSLTLIHSNENSFSTSDLSKWIDKLTLKGYNVKLVAVDYIDVMTSSTGYTNSIGDDYNIHGLILHEMRVLSRLYKIPILTITQNVRSSENPQFALSNSMIGDSIKKVRYADYIYMIRLRYDIDILSDQVREDTDDMNDIEDTTTNIFATTANEDLENLYPFEVKITKAKEGKKDKVKFHLFNGYNLRIYDKLSQFYRDLPKVKKSRQYIESELKLLTSDNSIEFIDDIDDISYQII